MSPATIVGANVKLSCTIFSIFAVHVWHVLTVPARDQRRELLSHPQFIRSGQPVNCVAVSERPISSTTATACTNDCNQRWDNHLVVPSLLGASISHSTRHENAICGKSPDKSCLGDVT